MGGEGRGGVREGCGGMAHGPSIMGKNYFPCVVTQWMVAS
jgi:hypothetical protein